MTVTKKGSNIRLRRDQIAAIDRIVADDPEMDRSKFVRKAIDRLLAIKESNNPRKAKPHK